MKGSNFINSFFFILQSVRWESAKIRKPLPLRNGEHWSSFLFFWKSPNSLPLPGAASSLLSPSISNLKINYFLDVFLLQSSLWLCCLFFFLVIFISIIYLFLFSVVFISLITHALICLPQGVLPQAAQGSVLPLLLPLVISFQGSVLPPLLLLVICFVRKEIFWPCPNNLILQMQEWNLLSAGGQRISFGSFYYFLYWRDY